MASSTLLQVISSPSVIPSLISGVVAAGVALGGQYYFFRTNREEKRYRKFYGPLTYNLMRMRLLTDNKKGLIEEISGISNIESRNEEFTRNVYPLIVQWNEHKNCIERLAKEYPGYIRKEDLQIIGDFLDGCIKRDVMEDGRNRYASSEKFDKLLDAVRILQKKLLP